jgi:hypothetical protein
MIIGYLKTRLKPAIFFVLATLLALLAWPFISFYSYLSSVFFLFFSFMAFRLLDDAGSVHVDRKNHPERSYLKQENYKRFATTAGIALVLYLVLIAIFIPEAWLAVAILVGLSIVAYLLLGKTNLGLAIIALIKYPILLWCIIKLPEDASLMMLVLSSFFMLAAHDLIEEPSNARNYALGFISLLLSGILIFQPWTAPFSAALILPVILVAAIFRKSRLVSFFHIAYYPISYALLNYFL